MLKNKILIIVFFTLLLSPKISISQEIEKLYSFNGNFKIISDNDFIVEIEGDFEKDLTGLFYKNIKIFYDTYLEFNYFEIKYKEVTKTNLKFKPHINYGGKIIYNDSFPFPSENVIYVGNYEKKYEKFLLFRYYPYTFDELENVGRILKSFDIKIKFRRIYTTLTNKNLPQIETYLIIGKNELKDTIDFFIKDRIDDGFNVLFKPLEDFSLGDVKTNIRNYLKDNYKKLNIKYLLLLGDSSEIPYFRVYPYKNNFVLTDFFLWRTFKWNWLR